VTLDVLIVDDEALARAAVARQVAVALPGARVREAQDGFAALDAIREHAPDLLFLDVEMPELSGIDVLRQLPAPRPRVVFVTAYAHFAVEAFEHNATDYLVKPFTAERFAAAAARALAAIDADAKLSALERTLSSSGHRIERMAMRRGAGFDVVVPDDFVVLWSEAHYTHVHANGHVYVTELPLIHFEEHLDPAGFARAHRSALVNVKRIARITVDGLHMDNGMEVPLSRRNRGALLDAYRAR
jgi:two-component system LytT family response regulator